MNVILGFDFQNIDINFLETYILGKHTSSLFFALLCNVFMQNAIK
jgi:hypothetical protein